MRNTKKLIAVIMTIAILASMMVPALAASNQSQYDALAAAGLMRGTGAGADLEMALDRIQGFTLVVRAMGAEAEAVGMTDAEITAALANVEDATKIAAWARPYAAYVVSNEITIGVGGAAAGKIMFAPNATLSGTQFITMLLRAMGYEGVTLENCIEKAVEAKMLSIGQAVALGGKAQLIRDDAALAVFSAVKSGMMASATGVTPGAMSLLQKLVDAGVVTSAAAVTNFGYVAPAPAPAPVLTVAGIVANNMKTVVVSFNKELDKDSVTTDTVKITDKVSTVKLTADKKGVVIILTTALTAQSTSLEVVVDGVKDVAKADTVKAYKKTVVAADTAIPSILDVVVKDGKNLEIITSEPMNVDTANAFNVLSGIKLDGVTVIGKATPDFVNGKILVELATLKAAGTYAIELKDLADYAGYKALTFNKSIVIPTDTTAPSIVSATLKSNTVIEIVMNEALSDVGSFDVNGATVVPLVDGTDNTKYTLTLSTGYGIAALAELKIGYKDQKDIAGNKVSTKAYFTFKVEDDTALPTATVSVGDENKITITFSKTMASVGTIRLLDKDSKVKQVITSFGFKANTNNTVIELTGTQLGLDNVDVAKYYIKLSDMKDATVRGNALAEVSLPFDAKDTKNPTVSANYVTTPTTATTPIADDTITFYFSEAMEEASLKNLSNYVNAASGLSLAVTPDVSFKSIASDAKSVTFTYKNARALVIATDKFTVYAIKDLAGNMMTTATGATAVVKLGVETLTASAPVAVAVNKVEVTYSVPVSSVDPSTLIIDEISTGNTVAVGVSASIDTAGTTVTYTLNTNLDTNAALYHAQSNNLTLVKTAYGTQLTAGLTDVVLGDEIQPEYSSIAAGTPAEVIADQTARTANTITIKATEALANVAGTEADFVIKKGTTRIPVADYTVSLVSSRYIQIVFDATTTALSDGINDLVVDFNENVVSDASIAANKLVSFSGKTISMTFDSTAPTVTAAVTNATTITLTFSESMAAATVILANVSGTTVPSAVAYTAGATTAVVTVGNTTAGNTLIVSVNMTDVAGNAIAAAYTFTCP